MSGLWEKSIITVSLYVRTFKHKLYFMIEGLNGKALIFMNSRDLLINWWNEIKMERPNSSIKLIFSINFMNFIWNWWELANWRWKLLFMEWPFLEEWKKKEWNKWIIKLKNYYNFLVHYIPFPNLKLLSLFQSYSWISFSWN